MAPKSINNNFNICYSGKDTGLSKTIDIEGYFSSDGFLTEDFINHNVDSTQNGKTGNTLVLFPDGKVAFRNQHYDQIRDVISSWEINQQELGELFDWGNYTFNSDTIIIQYVNIPKTLNETWLGFELQMTVNESGSLTLESRRGFTTNNEYIRYDKGQENIYMFSDFVLQHNSFLPEMNIPKRFRKLYECQ